MIVEGNNSFEWKLQKLCEVIETMTDQAAQGNTRNIGVITQAISEMNRMQGHHAAVTTLNLNMGEDVYLSKLNEITLKLIKEKREQKIIECEEVKDDRAYSL